MSFNYIGDIEYNQYLWIETHTVALSASQHNVGQYTICFNTVISRYIHQSSPSSSVMMTWVRKLDRLSAL